MSRASWKGVDFVGQAFICCIIKNDDRSAGLFVVEEPKTAPKPNKKLDFILLKKDVEEL